MWSKNKAASDSMAQPLAATMWQEEEERDILQGKLQKHFFCRKDSNDENFVDMN